MRRHFRGIEPEPHGKPLLAADDDRGNPFDGLQPVLDLLLRNRAEFERREAVAVDADPDHGLRIGVLLGDNRLLNGVRQLPADARNPVPHVLGGEVDRAR